jgi:hypothetical protein
VIQGESHPQEFIPRLVDLLMQGQMPGTAIKPVLRMPA